MENNWKDKYDEIDFALDVYITERPHWGLPQMSYLNHEKKEWAPRSMDGLWFDKKTWRTWQQTKLTTTPLLKMEDIKPIKIEGSIGKFKWGF